MLVNALFLAGARWDSDSTNTLIFEHGTREALFDRANNKRQLWEEVTSEVRKLHPNANVTWESCERKWNDLPSTFKD